MREYKNVTFRQLKVGQEIKGTKLRNCSSGFSAIVKDVNSAFVTVLMWGENEKKINSEAVFQVEMTDFEIKEKYRESAKAVLRGIQNTLHKDQIGYHEMWNSWLYAGTIFEVASHCVKEKIQIVGHCKEIYPKTAMFSGDVLDIGVCAEYEDGERFWCHYRSSDLTELLEENKELLGGNAVRTEAVPDYEKAFANWDTYCEKVKALISAAGLYSTVEVDPNSKGRSDHAMHVYIKSLPVKGNKAKIERLIKIKGFHGIRSLDPDGSKYWYSGYIEIEV